jgi:hypothetical protein
MSYVTLIFEGAKPQRATEPPRLVPTDKCIGELGLRKHHYSSQNPPKIPSSENPHLDDFREAHAVAVHLTGDDAPPGWPAGWYVIPQSDIPIRRAREILAKYPKTDWENW